jgi:hypothetical protein
MRFLRPFSTLAVGVGIGMFVVPMIRARVGA